MSIKKVEIEVRVCDKCDKPIKGRLIVHVCPCCGKEICNKCQEIEDIRHKPKRKYTRKEKSIAEQSQELSTTPIEEK